MTDPRTTLADAAEPTNAEAADVVEPAGATAPRRGISRRGLLGAAGAGAVLGAAGGTGVTAAVMRQTRTSTGPRAEEVIRHNYSPHGSHQAGIVTPTPAVTRLVALDLLPARYDVANLTRLLKLWSGDVAALMSGRGVTGDVTPEMAQQGVSLSIQIGFGPRIFALPGLKQKAPTGFVDIPPMKHDKLDPRWCGGDLLLVLAADDPTTLAHATRAMVRDAETFATVRWEQEGSWRGTDPEGRAITGRNLFGQMDGSGNPKGQLLDSVLWPADPPAWFKGGTTLVVRRIEMNLDEWDTLTRNEQDRALGRKLENGAPLSGGDENTPPDFTAKDGAGRPVIPPGSHVARAHAANNDGRQILRRSVNYTHSEWVEGRLKRSSGLVFISYQANIAQQFLPLQAKLDAQDALNEWTTAIGSSVWAIPPGFAPDSWLARDLLS